jgi:hypothetical protein
MNQPRNENTGHARITNRNQQRYSEPTQSPKEIIVNKIISNMDKMNKIIADNPNEIKQLTDNIKNFTPHDYTRFFQVLSNFQFLSLDKANSLASNRNKDSVSINERYLKYNENELNLDSENDISQLYTDQISSDIIEENLVTLKDVPLKNWLKEGSLLNKEISHELSSISQSIKNLSFSGFFSQLILNLKKDIQASPNDISPLFHAIKIYTSYIYNNNIIKFEKEDKILLDFIIENSTYESFYSICQFWLYQDYLINQQLPINSDNLSLKRRYDSCLNEILIKIDLQKENLFLFQIGMNFEKQVNQNWVQFIENLPKINEKVSEHICNIWEEIKTNIEQLSIQFKKSPPGLEEQIPILKLLRNVYIRFRKLGSQDERILTKFIELTNSSDMTFVSLAIKFIKDNVYVIGDFEKSRIKENAITKFKELSIPYTGPNQDLFIKSRYPMFLQLCGTEKELIFELPMVYSDTTQNIKSILEKYFKHIFKNLEIFNAEKLISRCNENCLKIVLEIIDNMKMINTDARNIQEEKLLRKIKDYYKENSTFLEILERLIEKFPVNEFFTSFIYEKIKTNDLDKSGDSKLNENIKLFEKLNSVKNENIFILNSTPLGEALVQLFKQTRDKLLIYLTYLISSPGNKVNEIKIVLKYFKLIKKGENMDEELESFFHDGLLKLEYFLLNPIYFITMINTINDAFGDKDISKMLLGIKIS